MATVADVANGIKQTTTLINLLTSTPSPSISINGESIDLAGYLSNLTDVLPTLMTIQQNLEGPYQRITRMRS